MSLQSFRQALGKNDPTIPIYQQIKEHIITKIGKGEWMPRQKLPSENEIATILAISRMTVNRAFKELTEEGYLFREKGSGTFVAEPFQLTPFFELTPISKEIAIEGNRYRAQILALKGIHYEDIPEAIRSQLNNWENLEIVYSEICYYRDDLPIQHEKRYLLKQYAPQYLQQKFAQDCTAVYLQQICPILSQQHQLEAVMPEAEIQSFLKMPAFEACFKITERLSVGNQIMSYATQFYPSARYRFHSNI